MIVTPTNIDLNCDLGEDIGEEGRQSDAQLLRHVSSANIACGVHAGDEDTMRQTVIAARELGVAIGAHPGFPDRHGKGRRPMSLSAAKISDLVQRQIESLAEIARSEKTQVVHVKPHGALYVQAAVSRDVAEAVCNGVAAVDRSLWLIGQSGGRLLDVGNSMGLHTISEVFADRNYLANGDLVPRDSPNALLYDPEFAARRVLQMILQQAVIAENGALVSVLAQTVCIHGDHPQSLEFAQALRKQLKDAGIRVWPPVSNL